MQPCPPALNTTTPSAPASFALVTFSKKEHPPPLATSKAKGEEEDEFPPPAAVATASSLQASIGSATRRRMGLAAEAFAGSKGQGPKGLGSE